MNIKDWIKVLFAEVILIGENLGSGLSEQYESMLSLPLPGDQRSFAGHLGAGGVQGDDVERDLRWKRNSSMPTPSRQRQAPLEKLALVYTSLCILPVWWLTRRAAGCVEMEGTSADPRHNSHFISCLHSSLLQVSGIDLLMLERERERAD